MLPTHVLGLRRILQNYRLSPIAALRTVWTEAPSRHDLPSFYDATVEDSAKQPLTQLSLDTLLASGRGASLDHRKLLESAQFTWEELPKRLARRLLDLQLLPFIVVTNPHIKRVYEAYWHAFSTLRQTPVPTDTASNAQFTALLRRLVDEHAPMLDALAAGLREVRRKPLVGAHLRLDGFLEAMLRSRISRRVLAEQHVNLSNHRPGYIGVINLDLSIAESVDFAAGRCRQVCLEHFGVAPDVLITGDTALRAPYIPAHLDYMLYEVLKNASRAVVERHLRRRRRNRRNQQNLGVISNAESDASFANFGGGDGGGSGSGSTANNHLPPIQVRICGGDDDITIRISDQGGGIPPAHLDSVWEFGWTDLDPHATVGDGTAAGREEEGNFTLTTTAAADTCDEAGNSSSTPREGLGLDNLMFPPPHTGSGGGNFGGGASASAGRYRMAGLGFGLPLSRLYARYFGGDLKLVSTTGYGVDAYLQLKGLVADTRREWKEGDGDGGGGGGGGVDEVGIVAAAMSYSDSLRTTLDSTHTI